jgi:hypothetical protein
MEELVKLKEKRGPLRALLTEEEIQEHADMRKQFPTYPKLPRFILMRGVKGFKKNYNNGLMYSCTEGFRGRVDR